MSKGIIFDLDGTLVETAQDLMTAGNAFFEDLGFGSLLKKNRDESVAAGGGRAMIRFGLENNNKDVTEAILDYYYPKLLKHYEKCLTASSFVYPEVEDTLKKLIDLGWKLGVCTNKPEYLAEDLLRKLNLRKYFNLIVGSDTLPYRKPDPRTLIDTIKQMGLDISRTVMIGDSKTDIDTALAADIPIILVKFGHSPLVHKLSALKPAGFTSNVSAIPKLAQNIIKC